MTYSNKNRRFFLKETDITSQWLKELYEKTDFCVYCGERLTKGTDKHWQWRTSIQLDHITPLSKGGKHMKSNVRYICAKCNSMKRDQNDEEFRNKYLFICVVDFVTNDTH